MKKLITALPAILLCVIAQAQRVDPVSVSDCYKYFPSTESNVQNAIFLKREPKTAYVNSFSVYPIRIGMANPLTDRMDWSCLSDNESGSILVTSNGRNRYWGQVKKKHYSLNNSSFILRKGNGIIKCALSPSDSEYYYGNWRDDSLYGDVLMMDRKGEIFYFTMKYGRIRNLRPASEDESRTILDVISRFESQLEVFE